MGHVDSDHGHHFPTVLFSLDVHGPFHFHDRPVDNDRTPYSPDGAYRDKSSPASGNPGANF
jgi:hypothetical protein